MRPPPSSSRATGTAPTPISPARHAELLLSLIADSLRGIVVVTGPRGCGKTQFLRERIEPRLQGSVPMLFADCATGIPEAALHAAMEDGVVILDSFGRFVQLPETARTGPLEILFSPFRRATLVLVANNNSLPDIFDLRELAPNILEHVFQFPELRLSTELPRYSPSVDVQPLSWDGATLDALEGDLARLSDSTVTPVLLAIIDKGFREGLYDPKSPLLGLLEKHLESTVDCVRQDPALGENAAGIAAAILKEIVADGRSTLAGIAERFDVSVEVPVACRVSVKSIGLLRDSGAGELVLQPPQLQAVLERWLEEDRKASARSERYLTDGIDGRRKVGTLLPRERFDEIHAQRSLLRTTPERAAFLTLCALRCYPDVDPGPVNHWFRRIGDANLEVCTLIEGLADSTSPGARRRAAALMANCDEPKVQGKLCLAALEDDAAEVRQQSVQSLAAFPNKQPIRDALIRAASDGSVESRIRAIQALCIFPDKECADFLEQIVTQPGDFAVRGAAIQTLGLMHCQAGVAALVRVALRDQDPEDRERAVSALSHLGSGNLTGFGLDTVLQDWKNQHPAHLGQWWKKVGQWPAAFGFIFSGLFLHGLPLVAFRPLVAAVFFLIEIGTIAANFAIGQNHDSLSPYLWLLWFLNLMVSIAVGAWLSYRKQPPRGTFKRLLSNLTLGLTMLTSGLFFHGIGHLVTGRKRRALQLLLVELVALAAGLSTYALKNDFMLGIERSWFDKLSTFLLYLYRYGGFALSWLVAVSWLIMNERWGRRGPWRSEPYSRVIRALLKAPESALLLRRNLQEPEPKASSARLLLARFGDAVPGPALFSVLEQDLNSGRGTPPEIMHFLARYKDRKGFETVVSQSRDLLDKLPPLQWSPLIRVLVSYPTEGSIQCLLEHRRRFQFSQRVRLLLAMIARPFRGWHWTVRVAAAAVAGLALLIIADGIHTAFNPAWSDIKELRRSLRTRSADTEVTADYLAKKYPVKSAQELVPRFREANKPEEGVYNAEALAPSLGILTTCESGVEQADVDNVLKHIFDPDAQPADIEKVFAELQKTVHAQAVAALIFVASEPHPRRESIQEAAMQSLEDAAERGGSRELVQGLSALYDGVDKRAARAAASTRPEDQSAEDEQLQRVTDMLASIAKSDSQSAPLANQEISERAESLGKLLSRANTRELKQSALNALQLSRSPSVVAALKKFILSESAPLVQQTRNAEDVAEHAASAQNDKLQREFRSTAVDALRNINTPEANDALQYISEQQRTKAVLLPPEVAEKLGSRAKAVPLVQQSQVLQQEGKIDEALALARRAVETDPTYGDAHAALGYVLFQSRKWNEALAEFRAAAKFSSNKVQPYYMQALILYDLKHWSEAESAVTAAIGADPSYSANYTLLRFIYTDQEKSQQAVDLFRQLRTRYPGVAEINAQLDFLYHEKVSVIDAASGFENAYVASQRWFELVRDRDPIEARDAETNLDEARLTTGRYGEVIQSVLDLLASGHLDVNQRMTLYVLLLSAQILQDDRGAPQTLDSLSNLYETEFKPANVPHNWVYDGTVQYLLDLQPRSAKAEALVKLVQAINKTSSRGRDGSLPVVNRQLFDNLRRAMGSATVS